MSELKLYNTLTRKKEIFTPLDASNVRMYVCGPTVYDFAHIGNARPVIVFDVLFRLLRHLYGEAHVTYARNITDVDDKINARAARDFPNLPLNEAIRKVTEGTNAQYQADVLALGNLEPTSQPRATDHLDEMRAITERLVAKGFAYVAEEHVLFSPEAMNKAGHKLPRYGSLANRSLDEMIAGARVDVAPYKREATDFVLWKPSEPGQPGWPSPCGIQSEGRPGWHIECSAMSMAKLLQPFGGGLSCDDPVKNTFDIHGGGIDLVFPHHENEIAQSCCAFGSSRMANIWMHNGFLQVEGQKMSKSLGNFTTIREVLADWPGATARMAMLKTHYRQPIDWTQKGLSEAQTELVSWGSISSGFPVVSPVISDDFIDALLDDLNTSEALTILRRKFGVMRSPKSSTEEALNAFAEFSGGLQMLGISPADVVQWGDERSKGTVEGQALLHEVLNRVFERNNQALPDSALTPDQIIQLIVAARLAAREAKNWVESDRIRDELVAMGIQIMDSKDYVSGKLQTTWEVKR